MRLEKNGLLGTPIYKIARHIRAIILSKLWTTRDKKSLQFFSQFVFPGELVFDVGANIGNITKIMLELGAKVVAIEPQEEFVNILETLYGKNKQIKIVQKVLGTSEGEAELMICNANSISSVSAEWIEAVKTSGRFAEYSWEKKVVVPMTTLDQLIDMYGTPTFVKIDVEGFEYQVLKGLSKPIRFISFEFIPEFIGSALKCIEYLESLGDVLFNFSIGESMQLALDNFRTSSEVIKVLRDHNQKKLFGDIYCQFMGGLTSRVADPPSAAGTRRKNRDLWL